MADKAVDAINKKEADLKNQGKLDNKNETSIKYQKNCVKAAGNLENHTASQFDIGKMRALTNESEKTQQQPQQQYTGHGR